VQITLTRTKAFEASHRCWLPELDAAGNQALYGAEASPWGHGHNYTLQAAVRGKLDVRTGMVVNIKALDAALDTVVSALDHRYLNEEYAPLAGRVPTLPELVRAIWPAAVAALAPLPGVRLIRLRLAEGNGCWAATKGASDVEYSQTYTFSAAHRLHSPELDEATNLAIFGKCNNPHGHGHDYQLEVTLRGTPDPRTGLLFDPRRLDAIVQETILDAWDHRHLNEEAPPFDRIVPTAENIVRIAWERLAPRLEGWLARLTLYETPRSAFSYEGDAAVSA
jgi:6-pyruvoyltetrahydropterin/6-carboxytetrahydropterin synthase